MSRTAAEVLASFGIIAGAQAQASAVTKKTYIYEKRLLYILKEILMYMKRDLYIHKKRSLYQYLY